jgi:D-glutamate N-acetyltransferase
MKRYLVLAEGYSADPHYGKTARGVMRYGADPVVAVVDSERPGEDLDGVPVVASVDEALGFAPTTALVGVATAGGRLPEKWRAILESALTAGLDLESGMHQFLGDDPGLAALAEEHGAEIRDLRRAPSGLSVPTGENLKHDATVILTVGSDCAIGKMSVSLELDRGARERGLGSVFVPTGQTGIAIAGWGIAVDAVVADFIAGAAEQLVVEGAGRGDLLWVEGQGSLVHPDYSGVTLGLFHGSAPHFLVLCHQVGDTHIQDLPAHPIPSLPELVELHERIALPARPAKVIGLALNTRRLDEEAARTAIEAAESETGLPADDPVRSGPGRLLDAILPRVSRV